MPEPRQTEIAFDPATAFEPTDPDVTGEDQSIAAPDPAVTRAPTGANGLSWVGHATGREPEGSSHEPGERGKKGLIPPTRRGGSGRFITDHIVDLGFAPQERVEL